MDYELSRGLDTRARRRREVLREEAGEARLHAQEATNPRIRPRSSTRVLMGWILSLVFLTNIVVIFTLWWNGGGITGVHGWGDALASVGRVTGLLGAYLLLIQVILLVRLPPLERLVGLDRLSVWHRLNGKICLSLILAHVAFITAGYTINDRISLPAEVTTLLTSYPGMVEALIGTIFLVLVVVTSLIIVRRHLRYETWFLVHLLAYAGIILAWSHQIPTGNEFVTNAAAALFWSALYFGTLGMVVLFRFAQPLLRGLLHRMRVDEVVVEGPGVVSIRITGRHLDRLQARAGQFFLWRFLSMRGHWWEAHPFSLSEAPDGKSLRITVKNSGDFTQRIGEIRPGTWVIAEGPFGVFTDVVRRRDRVALIAGGIGISPIRALLEDMRGELVLIYRVFTEAELIFRDELEALARSRGIALHFVVGDHRVPGNENLLSADHLRTLVPNIASREVYVCGPPAMMRVTEQSVRRAGVPRECIHSEKFAL